MKIEPRYVVRPLPNGRWGVFDTFTQTFVEFEEYGEAAACARQVVGYNNAYERTL